MSMDQATFFEAIGRFCVAFEHCCRELEELGFDLLKDAGVRDEDTAHILLADLTAAPLAKVTRALFADRVKTMPDVEELNDAASCVFKAFNEVTALRNIVIHTKWLEPFCDPGWGRQDGLVQGRKIKASGRGNSTLYPNYSEATLREYAAACASTEKLIGLLRYRFGMRAISAADLAQLKAEAGDVVAIVKRTSD